MLTSLNNHYFSFSRLHIHFKIFSSLFCLIMKIVFHNHSFQINYIIIIVFDRFFSMIKYNEYLQFHNPIKVLVVSYPSYTRSSSLDYKTTWNQSPVASTPKWRFWSGPTSRTQTHFINLYITLMWKLMCSNTWQQWYKRQVSG